MNDGVNASPPPRSVGPLAGIRVVDLAEESAGLAGRILADLGADVVLIEPPEGVRARRLAPFVADEPGVERSCVHQVLNANKRSAIITDADQLRSLLAAADVVLHTDPSFSFGLAGGPVLVGVTPFGPDGPRSSWLGSDLVGAAAGGLAWVSGERGDPPTRGAAEVAFTMAALAAATAAIIGLRSRDRSPDALVEIDISVQ